MLGFSDTESDVQQGTGQITTFKEHELHDPTMRMKRKISEMFKKNEINIEDLK
ncbi:MAG: hypothetical protein M0P27_10555 [Bacteroidales bacterium]|nr:hypothetical protein [Bacteroidales bacterium]